MQAAPPNSCEYPAPGIQPGRKREDNSAGSRKSAPAIARRATIPILIIVENLPVPEDGRVWREACALRDAGYRVSVICPKGKGRSSTGYETLEGIDIHRHPAWEASTKAGYLLEYSWALVAEFYLTLKVFVRTRFRILQACNPPDTVFLLALFYKLLGVRFVFDHHDLSPELFEAKFGRKTGILYRLIALAERCSFKAANVSIATNETFRELAINRGGKRPEQVFVVRNCPDLKKLTRMAPRPEIKRDKQFMVVYVGYMGTQDGLFLLLDSIEHLVGRCNRRDVQFVLVGDGSELNDLRASATARGLEPYLTFVGKVPHEDVGLYLSSADVGVAPDPKNPLNDSSTMIKIFEYMAFGLPVVLFDLKEGRRIASAAALYACPNDTIDFANQIAKLLDTPELRQRLGNKGLSYVEERLNWETELKMLLNAYEKALSC